MIVENEGEKEEKEARRWNWNQLDTRSILQRAFDFVFLREIQTDPVWSYFDAQNHVMKAKFKA